MKKEYTYDCDIFHADGTPADSFCSSVAVEEDEDSSMERLAAFTAAYQQAAGNYIHQTATLPGKIEIALVNEGNEGCPVEEIRPVTIATLDAIRADLAATAEKKGLGLGNTAPAFIPKTASVQAFADNNGLPSSPE
jgi:hypothetical protein